MRHKKFIVIFVWFLYIAGFSFLAYPFVSNTYHQWVQKSVTTEYQKNVASKDEKELETIRKKMKKHNSQLVDQQSVMEEEDFGVEAERNVQKGLVAPKREELGEVIAVLEIPKINVELPVYHGTNSQQISNGAGVMKETSLPFGGKGTHAVITSHRGLPTAKLFTDLPELKQKDLFFIKVAGETHAYEVDRIKVIEPEDFRELEVVKGEDYITLLTCTPYMVNTHRLLVRGHRVNPYKPELHQKAVKTGRWHQLKKYTLYALTALAIFALFYLLKRYRDKKEKIRRTAEIAAIKKKRKRNPKKQLTDTGKNIDKGVPNNNNLPKINKKK